MSGKRKKDRSDVPLLIRCGNHSYAPWVITCIHLIEGLPPEEWKRIELADDDLREIEADYICNACFEKFGCSDNPDLRPVCLHCFRYMKSAGFKDA